jgi:hypothetical protein
VVRLVLKADTPKTILSVVTLYSADRFEDFDWEKEREQAKLAEEEEEDQGEEKDYR